MLFHRLLDVPNNKNAFRIPKQKSIELGKLGIKPNLQLGSKGYWGVLTIGMKSTIIFFFC